MSGCGMGWMDGWMSERVNEILMFLFGGGGGGLVGRKGRERGEQGRGERE